MPVTANNKGSTGGKKIAAGKNPLAGKESAIGEIAIGADLSANADAFTAQLAQWFARHRRILPWRENPSAYKTVVSELMLQQTQVVTALPYFERWLARWPDFESLAVASEADVLQMWEGLGYYTRARNLLKLARAWVQADEKPRTTAEWLAYPGVGPYTAAAIASIAFNEHSAVVDGNVVRVLARLSANATAFPSAAHAVKAFTPLAQAVIARAENPGLHNEAMMELGATLCRKGQSQCLLCPVGEFCEGKSLGLEVDTLPRIARKKIEQRLVNRVLVLDHERNAILLYRYGQQARRLAGLCELPLWQDVVPLVANAPTEPPPALKPLLIRRRSIANERIEERIYAMNDRADSIGDIDGVDGRTDSIGGAVAVAVTNEVRRAIAGTGTLEGEKAELPADGLFWQGLDALDAVTLTGPHRRWLSQLLEKKQAWE